jgi:LuxR family maltose regulon positive regulatory protein
MTAEKTTSAKIARPTLAGVVERKRLFSILDGRVGKPVTWLSAPAGSGKSTLVASYLDDRELPCIWYQCDEGDTDLATFFYYMGLAAKKAAPWHKKPLPLLTSEYLAGIPTFTRRYFERLYSLLITRQASSKNPPMGGFTIVLDNYQDVPADSPFHDMIADGFDAIPEGVHIVMISRGGPPSAFARLHANDKIDLLQYSDIRFTFEESRELAHGRIPKLKNERIKAMHEKTEGWAAGIILMLERGRLDGTGTESAADFAYERVFDYFAGEIFNRTDKGVQEFLLKTAFLPLLSVPLAEKLTGVDSAESILSTLNRHHFFTEKLSGSGRDYQYHPLFRDFLLNRVKTVFSPDELADIQQEAALLLEQAGQIEDAARLYGDAGDRDGLAGMVVRHARELLFQGRNKTVEEWIAAIPGEQADDDPWLLYWTGICSFPLDIPRARKFLEKAFVSFRAKDDTSGIYLSWAGIVDTYAFGDEWKCLDDCISVFDDLRRTYPSFPSREIDLIASSRMLFSLTLRKTDRPQWVHRWLQRVSALLQENPSFDIQMDTVFCMSVYYLWKGEYNKNAVLLERAEAEIRHRKPSPFAVIRIKLMKGIHYWITAEYDAALHTLSEGLDISAKSGVHVFDSLLWGFRGAAEMAPGNMELASISLNNQMTALLGMEKTLDIFFYHINSAWHAILTGNPSRAAEHMETVSAKVAKMGTPYYRALWHIGMAHVAFLLDRPKDAKAHVQTAHRISLSMKSHVMEWYTLLIDAWFLLQEGRETEGLQSLCSGLSLGKRHGYVHLEFYQPQVMRFLFAKALEEGIERHYVKGLIRKLGLTPPNPLASSSLPPLDRGRTGGVIMYLEEWPYPVKIYTLGRFEIIRDDEPLHFSGKEQKKPLEMLKVLIAFGGSDVPEERLTDALWPEADGDLAHKSFETTLGRLRRLLGGDVFVRYRARQLTINPLYCWVDTLALEHLFDTIRESPGERVALLCEKAVGLHKGPFLPSDAGQPWTLPSRETLKNRLLRTIIKVGRHYEQAGEWERAAEHYTKGIETDSLAEELYRRLMICHSNLGDHAAAVKTFNRCRDLLQAELGIVPSPETLAAHSSIMQTQ